MDWRGESARLLTRPSRSISTSLAASSGSSAPQRNVDGELDLSEFTDEYQAELRRVIDAKVAGEEVVVTEDEAPAKVVDLMDALRKSLDSVSKSKKKPAKAIEKRAAPRKRKRGSLSPVTGFVDQTRPSPARS